VRLWDCRGLGIQGTPENELQFEENDDVRPNHMGIKRNKTPVAPPGPVDGGVLGDFLGIEPEEPSPPQHEMESLTGDGLGAMKREMETGDQVFGLRFWPHRPSQLAAGTDDRIQFWDLHRGVVVASGTLQSGAVRGQAFGGPRNESDKAYVFGLDFSPDGALLAAAGSDGGLHLIDPSSLSLVAVLPEGEAPVASAEFSAAGDAVVVSSTDGSCSVWDLRMGQKRVSIAPAHHGPAYQSKWVEKDSFVTTGHDSLVKLWDANDGHLLAESRYSSQLLCCSVSNKTRGLVGVAGGGGIGILQAARGGRGGGGEAQQEPKL